MFFEIGCSPLSLVHSIKGGVTVQINDIITAIRPLDEASMAAARARQDMLTKPQGSLGRLEELSIQLAGITRACPPPVPSRKTVLVFAGDHGVVAQGVSAFPQEVTPQMVYNFLRGGAAINVLGAPGRRAGCRHRCGGRRAPGPGRGSDRRQGGARHGRHEPGPGHDPGASAPGAGPGRARGAGGNRPRAGSAGVRRDGHRQHDPGDSHHRNLHRPRARWRSPAPAPVSRRRPCASRPM